MLSNKIKFNDIKNLCKIWNVLPFSIKKKTYLVLILTTIGTFLEAIGIGLVIPAISLIANIDTEIFDRFTYYKEITADYNKNQIAIGASILLLILYFIKAAFLTLMYFNQARYIFNLKAHISYELLQKYLYTSYENIAQRKTSDFISNLTTEIQLFTSRVTKPMLTLITEIGVILATSILFLIIEPIGAILMVVSLIVVVFLYERFSRKSLLKWGLDRHENEAKKVKIAQESILGLREIKLTGTEKSFLQIFNTYNNNSSNAEAKEEALYNVPRISLELVGVWGVLIIVLLTTIQNKGDGHVILTISFFAAMAFRLLPSVNRIVGALQSISYCTHIIETIASEISKKTENLQNIKNTKLIKEIEFKNVDYKYPNSADYIFKSINITIGRGECIGVVGKSGVGKSTFADLLSGLLEPKSGSILIDGEKKLNNHLYLQKMVGYIQQRIFLSDDSIKKNIAIGIDEEKIDLERVINVLRAANLMDFINTLPDGVNTNIGELGGNLSGGQKQRLNIARALYRKPEILIFDEGTSALDEANEDEIIKTLLSIKDSTTIIIISHRPSTLKICNKIYNIDEKKLQCIRY